MLTLPNLVSLARVAAVPVFLWLLLGRRDVAAAAGLLAVIGATDWVDGYLARRLGQVTALGELLDPVADRLAVTAALLGGWAAGIVPGVLAGALVLREAAVGAASLWLAVSHLPRIEVRPMGKAGTLLLYVAIPAFYVAAAGVAPGLLRGLAWVVGTGGGILYYAVLVQYADDLRRLRSGH